jgi:uncharacterized protein (TIGR02996 family)
MKTDTDRDGLLRAILADPESDLHRLSYADFLEEHGDQKRAEFIRQQIAGDETAKPSIHWCYPASWGKMTWSRGFVSRVEGPLAVLVGGECGVCARVGMRGDAFDLCPSCNGTGRVPGVLERIVREHPVEEVKTDREPYEHSGKYSWWRKEEWLPILASHQQSNIPNVIFDKIAEMFPDSCQDWSSQPLLQNIEFPTRAAAHKALSDAILALVRGEPITTTETTE